MHKERKKEGCVEEIPLKERLTSGSSTAVPSSVSPEELIYTE
jgi:hypothetical protein